jgi:hypothetical protein
MEAMLREREAAAVAADASSVTADVHCRTADPQPGTSRQTTEPPQPCTSRVVSESVCVLQVVFHIIAYYSTRLLITIC